jgi:hypothetical protein
MFARMIPLALVAFGGLAGGQQKLSAQPFGFERWTAAPHIDNQVRFKQHPEALEFLLIPLGDGAGELPHLPPSAKPWRAIDIEWTGTDPITKRPLFDTVLVENKDDFFRHSWFGWNFTRAQVEKLARRPDLIIIDIERYTTFFLGELRFAMIVVENPRRHAWKVVLDIDQDTLYSGTVGMHSGWRPLDIDYYEPGEDVGTPTFIGDRYDCVLVANSGAQKVEFLFNYGGIDEPKLLGDEGWQTYDLEPVGKAFRHFHPTMEFALIVVRPVQPQEAVLYKTHQTEADILFDSAVTGRPIDIEKANQKLAMYLLDF